MENKIEKENYTIDEVVELFATKKQKERYSESHEYDRYIRKTVEEKMERLCEFKKDHNIYHITKVRDFPLPSNFKKMNSSLYQYLCPIILQELKNSGEPMITITVGKWARNIEMVNSNYNLIKYNKEEASDVIHIDKPSLYDFYKKADEGLNNYITNSLEYLKSAGVILWQEVYYVDREVVDGEVEIDYTGKVNVNRHIESVQATQEEVEFYAECVGIVDKEMGITSADERFFGDKSYEWKRRISKLLYDGKQIKSIHKRYQIYAIDIKKCTRLLNQFPQARLETRKNKLTKEFSAMLIENAGNRYLNRLDIYEEKYSCQKEYIDLFDNMCNIVINRKAQRLSLDIKKKNIYTLEDDNGI